MAADRTPPRPDHVDRLAQWLYESAPRRSDVGRFAWSALPEDGVGGKAHHREWAGALLASEEWQARETVVKTLEMLVTVHHAQYPSSDPPHLQGRGTTWRQCHAPTCDAVRLALARLDAVRGTT